MKKYITLIFLLLLTGSGLMAQAPRSDEFHSKYKLKEVVVFSRHNIRAPMAVPGGLLTTGTPHEWCDFGVAPQELTMKGGSREVVSGQFFREWAVKEGLFPNNAEPSEEELYVLANSKQRTISTARHFMAAFMPMQNVPVHHAGAVGTMDRNFSLDLGDDLTDAQMEIIRKEYKKAYIDSEIRNANISLKPGYDLLADILDIKDSKAYREGTFKGFDNPDGTISLVKGREPAITGSLADARTFVDALIQQYYVESGDSAAFGKKLTFEQWRKLAGFLQTFDSIRYSSSFVQHYVSERQRQIISDELQNKARKFTFICGHDTNIYNILRCLRTNKYTTEGSIECGEPIGSKIVFEKWADAAGNEFVAVNLVYQSSEQIRGNLPVNMTSMPVIIPLSFDGLETNSDGLYTLGQIINRLAE